MEVGFLNDNNKKKQAEQSQAFTKRTKTSALRADEEKLKVLPYQAEVWVQSTHVRTFILCV